MSDLARLESDLSVLRAARSIIAAATLQSRRESVRNADVGARTDIGIAVEYLDHAMDLIDDAIDTIAPHLPSFTPPSCLLDYDPEPHGARDTFVPHPSEGPDAERFNPLQD